MFQVCLLIPIQTTLTKNLQQNYLLTGPIIVNRETNGNADDDENYINKEYIKEKYLYTYFLIVPSIYKSFTSWN